MMADPCTKFVSMPLDISAPQFLVILKAIQNVYDFRWKTQTKHIALTTKPCTTSASVP